MRNARRKAVLGLLAVAVVFPSGRFDPDQRDPVASRSVEPCAAFPMTALDRLGLDIGNELDPPSTDPEMDKSYPTIASGQCSIRATGGSPCDSEPGRATGTVFILALAGEEPANNRYHHVRLQRPSYAGYREFFLDDGSSAYLYEELEGDTVAIALHEELIAGIVLFSCYEGDARADAVILANSIDWTTVG